MLDDKTVWRLTKMVDVCLTNIISRPDALSASYNTFKFSYVISQDQFSEIKEFAEDVYAIMTFNEQYCPIIIRDGDGIMMRYDNENRTVLIIIHPNKKMRYKIKGQVWMELPKLSILDETLTLLCRFLDKCQEVA